MMKKNILIFTFFCLFVSQVNAECKYQAQIDQCSEALDWYNTSIDWAVSFITSGESIKTIDEFICLQAPAEERILQIVLDNNFKKVDAEVDAYLASLDSQKDKYFGQDSDKTYLDWVNEISKKSEEFKNKYHAACQTTYNEALSCIWTEDSGNISIAQASKYLNNQTNNSSWECYSLANVKIEIFNNVSFNILLLNKQQVLKDEKKLYEQETRTKYDWLLDLMIVNMGYMERIWQKWTVKVKNVY